MKVLNKTFMVIVILWIFTFSFPQTNILLKGQRCVQDDDYCDCGYDEPSTSACSGLELSQSTDIFICHNTGYLNQSFSFSKVFDRVCDCCDGSDEVKFLCINTCAVANIRFIEETNRLNELKYRGKRIRDEIVDKSIKYLDRIFTLKDKHTELRKKYEIEIEELKKKLKPLEKAEKKDYITAIEEARTVSLSGLRDLSGESISREKLHLLIASLTISGKEESVTKTLLELNKLYSLPGNEPDDNFVLAVSRREYTHNTNHNQVSVGFDGIVENGPNEGIVTIEILSSVVKALSLIRLDENEIRLVFHEVLARALNVGNEVVYNAFTYHGLPKIVAMLTIQSSPHEVAKRGFINPEAHITRESIRKLEDSIKNITVDMVDVERLSKYNFGENYYLYSLFGQCYEINSNSNDGSNDSDSNKGYQYKICPFGDAKQNQITLGIYSRHEEVKRNRDTIVKLYFENGDYCFATKRPRNIVVTMICSPDTILKDIDEVSVCSYTATLESPLACFHNPYSNLPTKK